MARQKERGEGMQFYVALNTKGIPLVDYEGTTCRFAFVKNSDDLFLTDAAWFNHRRTMQAIKAGRYKAVDSYGEII